MIAFVCGRELSRPFGDIQHDAQRGPLQLIGEVASPLWQVLNDVVHIGEEREIKAAPLASAYPKPRHDRQFIPGPSPSPSPHPALGGGKSSNMFG
jgi:hypothetical protein